MIDSKFYEAVEARLFGGGDWSHFHRKSAGVPKVVFQIDADYNELSGFIAYDFITELAQQYGEPILPIEVKDGCVSVTVTVENTIDRYGVDFRLLALQDAGFHDVFHRYKVQQFFVHSFPGESNLDHNIAFVIDDAGKPVPAKHRGQIRVGRSAYQPH